MRCRLTELHTANRAILVHPSSVSPGKHYAVRIFQVENSSATRHFRAKFFMAIKSINSKDRKKAFFA